MTAQELGIQVFILYVHVPKLRFIPHESAA